MKSRPPGLSAGGGANVVNQSRPPGMANGDDDTRDGEVEGKGGEEVRSRPLTYRITGELARRRLHPLLQQTPDVDWVVAAPDTESLDFVWETHVPREWKSIHGRARVLNRLLNSTLLENKANFAVLHQRMRVPTLQTFILRGDEVKAWAEERWGRQHHDNSTTTTNRGGGDDDDWWIVKATGANGGADVFVLHDKITHRVLPGLQPREQYVVQRYITRPSLYQGRKFHFRCYAVLRGDLTAYLYRRAYILAASNPYSLGDSDDLTHLTNLSVNKVVDWYPGEIPTTLPEEYPQAWGRMKETWADVVRAAAPFLAVQTSVDHFDFFGLDYIVDMDGTAWLLEANRLPGITSSKQNQEEEDRFFDGVISDLLGLCVLPPLTGAVPVPGNWELVNSEAAGVEVQMEVGGQHQPQGWKNVLRFGMFASSSANKAAHHKKQQQHDKAKKDNTIIAALATTIAGGGDDDGVTCCIGVANK